MQHPLCICPAKGEKALRASQGILLHDACCGNTSVEHRRLCTFTRSSTYSNRRQEHKRAERSGCGGRSNKKKKQTVDCLGKHKLPGSAMMRMETLWKRLHGGNHRATCICLEGIPLKTTSPLYRRVVPRSGPVPFEQSQSAWLEVHLRNAVTSFEATLGTAYTKNP